MSAKKKQKTKDVTLIKVPIEFEGLPCWCALDKSDEIILDDKSAIHAQVPVEGRSLPQNSLWAVWYNQISKELKEDTPEAVKKRCKLDLAVPILLGEDREFRAFYMNTIANLNYEQRLFCMKFTPVTSLLSKPGGHEYQTTLQAEYAKLGVILRIL